MVDSIEELLNNALLAGISSSSDSFANELDLMEKTLRELQKKEEEEARKAKKSKKDRNENSKKTSEQGIKSSNKGNDNVENTNDPLKSIQMEPNEKVKDGEGKPEETEETTTNTPVLTMPLTKNFMFISKARPNWDSKENKKLETSTKEKSQKKSVINEEHVVVSKDDEDNGKKKVSSVKESDDVVEDSLNVKEKKTKKVEKQPNIVKNTFEYPSISITEDLTGWKGGYNQLFGRRLNKKVSKNSKNVHKKVSSQGLFKTTTNGLEEISDGLPEGWKVEMMIISEGPRAGDCDTFIHSPFNTKFGSESELRSYFKQHPERLSEGLDIDSICENFENTASTEETKELASVICKEPAKSSYDIVLSAIKVLGDEKGSNLDTVEKNLNDKGLKMDSATITQVLKQAVENKTMVERKGQFKLTMKGIKQSGITDSSSITNNKDDQKDANDKVVVNEPIVKSRKRNLNKPNRHGETLLHAACIKLDEKKAETLIKEGALVNTCDYNGWTPLHEVAQRGHKGLVKLLLDADANPNIPGGDENMTPLHDAAAAGHVEIFKLLKERGADSTITDAIGRTPLQLGRPGLDLNALENKETRKDEKLCEQNTPPKPLETGKIINIKSLSKSIQQMTEQREGSTESKIEMEPEIELPKLADGTETHPIVEVKRTRKGDKQANPKALKKRKTLCLDKRRAKRQRAKLQDQMVELTKEDLRRMARQGGEKEISGIIYSAKTNKESRIAEAAEEASSMKHVKKEVKEPFHYIPNDSILSKDNETFDSDLDGHTNLKIVSVMGSTELSGIVDDIAVEQDDVVVEEKKGKVVKAEVDESLNEMYRDYAWEEPMLTIGDSIKNRSRKASKKYDANQYEPKDIKKKIKAKNMKDYQGGLPRTVKRPFADDVYGYPNGLTSMKNEPSNTEGLIINETEKNVSKSEEGEKVVLRKKKKTFKTLLHRACIHEEIEKVKGLIQDGLIYNVNTNDDKGRTPLHEAAEKGNLELARLLLKAQANPNLCTFKDNKTPLNMASTAGNVELITLLIQHGAADKETKEITTDDIVSNWNIELDATKNVDDEVVNNKVMDESIKKPSIELPIGWKKEVIAGNTIIVSHPSGRRFESQMELKQFIYEKPEHLIPEPDLESIASAFAETFMAEETNIKTSKETDKGMKEDLGSNETQEQQTTSTTKPNNKKEVTKLSKAELVVAAIKYLGEKKGSNKKSVKKIIVNHIQAHAIKNTSFVHKELKRCVSRKILCENKNRFSIENQKYLQKILLKSAKIIQEINEKEINLKTEKDRKRIKKDVANKVLNIVTKHEKDEHTTKQEKNDIVDKPPEGITDATNKVLEISDAETIKIKSNEHKKKRMKLKQIHSSEEVVDPLKDGEHLQFVIELAKRIQNLEEQSKRKDQLLVEQNKMIRELQKRTFVLEENKLESKLEIKVENQENKIIELQKRLKNLKRKLKKNDQESGKMMNLELNPRMKPKIEEKTFLEIPLEKETYAMERNNDEVMFAKEDDLMSIENNALIYNTIIIQQKEEEKNGSSNVDDRYHHQPENNHNVYSNVMNDKGEEEAAWKDLPLEEKLVNPLLNWNKLPFY